MRGFKSLVIKCKRFGRICVQRQPRKFLFPSSAGSAVASNLYCFSTKAFSFSWKTFWVYFRKCSSGYPLDKWSSTLDFCPSTRRVPTSGSSHYVIRSEIFALSWAIMKVHVESSEERGTLQVVTWKSSQSRSSKRERWRAVGVYLFGAERMQWVPWSKLLVTGTEDPLQKRQRFFYLGCVESVFDCFRCVFKKSNEIQQIRAVFDFTIDIVYSLSPKLWEWKLAEIFIVGIYLLNMIFVWIEKYRKWITIGTKSRTKVLYAH